MEGLADVAGCSHWIRLAVRAFWIDVDEAHLDGAQRVLQIALAAIAFVAEPGSFWTPIQFLRLPLIGAPACKAKRLEAHRFERDVAGENVEVGPRELVAVLLLDRPQE